MLIWFYTLLILPLPVSHLMKTILPYRERLTGILSVDRLNAFCKLYCKRYLEKKTCCIVCPTTGNNGELLYDNDLYQL